MIGWLCSLSILFNFGCGNITSTPDLLDLNFNGDIPLVATPSSVSIQTAATQQFIITGGSKPYTVQLSSGAGTARIEQNVCTFTAPDLAGTTILVISDSKNKQLLITAQIKTLQKQPNELPGLVLWLKADSITATNGASVTSWPDTSGANRNFNSGTGATYITAAINNLNALSFNGSSQYFERAYDAALNTSTVTAFVLHSPAAIGISTSFLSLRDETGGNNRGYWMSVVTVSTINVIRAVFGDGSAGWRFQDSDVVLTLNSWYLSDMTISANSVSSYVNAVLQNKTVTPNAYNTVLGGTPMRVGAGGGGALGVTLGNYYSGKVSEIVLFNRAISDSEAAGIRCYFKNRYALNFDC